MELDEPKCLHMLIENYTIKVCDLKFKILDSNR